MSHEALQRKQIELAKLKRLHKHQLSLAFDPFDPASRPTEKQLQIMKDIEHRAHFVIAGNRSGKTATGGRIVSWFLGDNHPYINPEDLWGNQPLTILVVGRTTSQLEDEIWEKKLKPFLDMSEIDPDRTGGILKKVTHRPTGNKIIFQSHHDAKNAREKVQAFTAQVVWLDEMPDDSSLLSELMLRTISDGGMFYATFTPLIRNEQIRKIVDNPLRSKVKHVLQVLDNPKYAGREEEIEEEIRALCASEQEFRARMYGEWYMGDLRVFSYNGDRNLRNLPADYDVTWRHVAFCDPSASGLTGLIVLAEDPKTERWYVTKAEYLNGDAAYLLVTEVEKHVAGLNVVLKMCDCNPAGFYKEAHRRRLKWLPYTDKSNRKAETIDEANKLLTTAQVYVTPEAGRLADEFVECSWDERNPDRIIHASKYHLADPFRYFADSLHRLPKRVEVKAFTPTQEIRQQWHQRRAKRDKAAAQVVERRQRWWNSRRLS